MCCEINRRLTWALDEKWPDRMTVSSSKAMRSSVLLTTGDAQRINSSNILRGALRDKPWNTGLNSGCKHMLILHRMYSRRAVESQARHLPVTSNPSVSPPVYLMKNISLMSGHCSTPEFFPFGFPSLFSIHN